VGQGHRKQVEFTRFGGANFGEGPELNPPRRRR
jgi:hypothetical protein